MLDDSELVAKIEKRALKFAGRADLSALAEIANVSYQTARERTSQLMRTLACAPHTSERRGFTRELEQADCRLKQALIEYAAVLRALGDHETIAQICQSFEARAAQWWQPAGLQPV